MKKYAGGFFVAGFGLFAFAACDRSPADTSAPAVAAGRTNAKANVVLVGESPTVRARLTTLRERFTVKERTKLEDGSWGTFTRPVIRPGVATAFIAGEHDMHAVFAAEAGRVTRPASTLLPRTGGGATELRDETSKMRIRFSLRGMKDVTVQVADGVALYPGALPDGDVAHRVDPTGTEDYVIFNRKPAREELTYDVDVSQAAGLRFVSNTIELLDEGGTPLLRVAPPYVVDRDGERHDAKLALTGCAYDQSPLGPWGRPVTKPGASSCQISVRWSDVAYPAIVDPEWTSTGDCSIDRAGAPLNVLSNGLVLVTGAAVAELYSSAGTGTFAVTDTPKQSRYGHTATTLKDGRVLLANGSAATGPGPGTAEIYDPTTAKFTATGAPPQNGNGHVAAMVASGNVLIAGGYTQTGQYSQASTPKAFLYNAAAGTWSEVGPMNIDRTRHTATWMSVPDKVLIAGGLSSGASPYLASCELFDPATNKFTYTANALPSYRIGHFASIAPDPRVFIIIGGDPPPPTSHVLIAGGSNTQPNPLVTYIYSSATDSFGTGPSLTYNREGIFGARSPNGGQIFLSGGSTDPAAQTNDILSTTIKGGYAINIMGTPPTSGVYVTHRWSSSMVALPSGQMLVVGGQTPYPTISNLKSAERLWVAYGETCAQNSDCYSNNCLDNRCCAGACSGICKTCAAGTGACVAVTSAPDPDTCTGANACDASGTCKLANGQTCQAGTDCASGNCVDTVCCDTGCGGSCDSCNLPGKAGTCSIAPLGDPGSPVCPTYACDGVSAACGTGCNSDAGCAADSYCATNGTCVPRKAIAAACDLAADCKSSPCRECTSGNCADGVCCSTACDGTCDACTAALKTSGADGECGPQKEGAAPVHGTCTADDPLTCKRDGKCSASGGCRLYYTAGQTCGASTCTGNSVTGFSCDGNGTCIDNQAGVECSPYKCTGGTCTSSCATSDECAADSWCNAGLCEKKRANGQACPSKDACENNICADGFCCNSPCTGQCEACDVKSAEGACTPVTDKPHGSRTACPAGDSACTAATCDGTTRATCAGFVGPSVTCGTASCADGKATSAGTCSNGSCQVPPPVPCGSYACGATACKTECTQNGDCATGNICDPTTKKCISGATCDGDHTTIDVSGAKTDCAPYKCEANGTCKPKCVSIDDCVSPNACDPASGKCVPPPGGDSGDSGGCSMSSGADPANGSLAAFALLALCFVRRRRGEARQ